MCVPDCYQHMSQAVCSRSACRASRIRLATQKHHDLSDANF